MKHNSLQPLERGAASDRHRHDATMNLVGVWGAAVRLLLGILPATCEYYKRDIAVRTPVFLRILITGARTRIFLAAFGLLFVA